LSVGKENSFKTLTPGVKIHYTTQKTPKSAGVYRTATFGRFPPHKTTKSEAACQLETDIVLHPFAFRVHTHALGRVVTGYKVSGNMQWTLLGKDDPQLPQMFNPTTDKSTTLTGGDIVATRCTMVNDLDSEVVVGPTRKDEMCNFYIMFWVEGEEVPDNLFCLTPGTNLIKLFNVINYNLALE
jgi:peptidylglycine monooxygenase